MGTRDGFSAATKELLAKRVGYRCSNPDCRQPTSGPQDDPNGTINVGVAAHLTAASSGGPRYDPTLTAEERGSPANGIWCCQTCGKLVDSDSSRYSLSLLRAWKQHAESAALRDLEHRQTEPHGPDASFAKAEGLMPDLLAEMRRDLLEDPLKREFVVLERAWVYWATGNELVYYHDDHPDLTNKCQLLENLGFIRDTTYNNATRYMISEEFADYLIEPDRA